MTSATPTPWRPEPILTQRLLIRPRREQDRDALIALLTDPLVREVLGGPLTEKEARERCAGQSSWGWFVIQIAESDDVVGTVTFDRKGGASEISYQLQPDCWGMGLASEAVRAAAEWFFSETRERELRAVTQTRNHRSRSLLERQGWTLTREFLEHDALQAEYRLLTTGSNDR